jgi:hypothetical protein
MAEESASNCWIECPVAASKIPGITEVAFCSLIISQFSNPMNIKLALAELKRLKWDPSSESLSLPKTYFISLFHRAGMSRTKVRDL